MKRYITINAITGSELFDYDDVYQQSYEDVDTIVDKSHFMPHSSVLSALEHGYSSNSNTGGYDSSDSLKNGSIPINRRHGQTITEIYCEAQKLSSDMKIKSEKLAQKRKDEAIINKVFSTPPTSSSSSTSST